MTDSRVSIEQLLTSVAPHSLEAERAVLGGCLVDGKDAVSLLRLEPTDFYKEGHRQIFAVIQELAQEDLAVTIISVSDVLRQRGRLDEVGGINALTGLEIEAGLITNLPTYAQMIREKRVLRDLIYHATAIIGAAYEERPLVEVLQTASSAIAAATERVDLSAASAAPPDEHIGVIATRVVQDLATTLPAFVVPPVRGLERLLFGGWLAGELVYLGSGPGTGKTGMATEWAGPIAEAGHMVLIVSAEMTKEALTRRVLTQRTEIPARDFRSGTIAPEDWPKLTRALPDLAALPIVIDDQSVTLGAIRQKVAQYQPRLCIVDYIQLLQPPHGRGSDRGEQRRLEIDALSRGLKKIAKRAGCVMLVLSQINLVPDGKGWFQRPLPTSLKESRGLLADADTVLLLWCPKPKESYLELIVAKGRDHATGSIDLHFTPHYLHFREL